MLYLYTSLQSIVQTSDAFQTAVLSDKEQTQDQAAEQEAKRTISTGKRLQCKSALLWAHHLLANSKRKDIQHWSTELKVWAIAKIGCVPHLSHHTFETELALYATASYPGVMVFQGIAEDVDEFIRRIKVPPTQTRIPSGSMLILSSSGSSVVRLASPLRGSS